ncbi:hypothetical protein [Desulfonema magnum]|uniref:Uncharacterized protein n=1 Tax=Desulfonema magnum TaxID=45655 RepID=A0A975BYP8_9BACT|nr:hypothetical protein [Desulfonema magnum]QTA93905.1 Uncharacterized protein dnm_100130 [Desulfonema magnum]
MLCSFATLENDKVDEIKALEKEIGKTMVAFSCHDVKATQLSEDELAKIKKLEDKMGLSLVAVNA